MKDPAHRVILDVRRLEGELGHFPSREEYENGGKFGAAIALLFGNWGGVERAIKREATTAKYDQAKKPKILIFDIECCQHEVRVWGLKHNDYIHPDRIRKNRAVIAWAAKWYNDPPSKILYMDQRGAKNFRDDREILLALYDLLIQADMIITKNGKRFDQRVVNGRLGINKIKPLPPVKHEDIENLYRKYFDLPSYRMDFLADTFCTKYKKLKHKKFPGNELWDECEAGNMAAWGEMEKYNKHDVLVTEELREIIAPWGSPGINMNLLHGDAVYRCECCGSVDLQFRGQAVANAAVYRRFQCNQCGRWGNTKGAGNSLFTEKKKMSLKGPA